MNGQHDSNASFNPKICDKNVSTTTVISLPAQNSGHQPCYSTSRWNPTTQQLLALEEIYRLGTRTPTAEEIQQITQQLRRFGKIEAKNVFYWFQNHKARERMKRRREVELTDCGKAQNRDCIHESNEYKKESGLRRTVDRDEQVKNCNFKHSEGFVLNSMQKATNAKWLTTTSRTTTLINPQSNKSPSLNRKRDNTNVENEIKEVEFLELFPLCSSTVTGNCDGGTKKDIKIPIRAINTNLSPNQFFEFLPLKN